MFKRNNCTEAANIARRRFLGLAAAAAGRVGAGSAIGALPTAAMASSPMAAICFMHGTRMLTSRGEVPVEHLQTGDFVVTASGRPVRIKSMSQYSFTKTSAGWPNHVQAIRVSRFALDDQTPRADLYLSPEHALSIGGGLIRVKELVNGDSIMPAMPEGVDSVVYFQIELERHQILVAEGTPAATYL